MGNYIDNAWHFDVSASVVIHPPPPQDPKDTTNDKSEQFVIEGSTDTYKGHPEEHDDPANSPNDDDDVFKIGSAATATEAALRPPRAARPHRTSAA